MANEDDEIRARRIDEEVGRRLREVAPDVFSGAVPKPASFATEERILGIQVAVLKENMVHMANTVDRMERDLRERLTRIEEDADRKMAELDTKLNQANTKLTSIETQVNRWKWGGATIMALGGLVAAFVSLAASVKGIFK